MKCPPHPLRARLLVVLLLAALPAQADDWPQWRGINRDGSWNETGIMETFPKEGLSIVWRAPVGKGWSSPVVVQGRVYARDSDLNNPKARERLHCFDAATGKQLWTQAYDVTYPDWAFAADQAYGPISTPCVRDGKVYTLGQRGDVYCVAATTGTVLWHRNMMADYKVTEFLGNLSPLIEDKLLILPVGGKPDAGIVALDKDTGREAWHALDEDQTNSSPLVVTAAGRRQLIVWTNQSVSSLDPATGKLLWRERLLTPKDNAVATPVCDGTLLLVGGMMFSLDAGKPAAIVLWPESHALAKRILSNTSTAMLKGGHVYALRTNGEFVCLDALTGKQLWTTDKVTDKRTSFGPCVHLTSNAGSVLLYNDKGELIRAMLTPQGYQEISRALLLAPTYKFGGHLVNWAPPAYADGRVFARNENGIVCAELRAGR